MNVVCTDTAAVGERVLFNNATCVESVHYITLSATPCALGALVLLLADITTDQVGPS